MSAIEPTLEARHPALADAGARVLLSGNEAIARGAWEAGLRLAAAYPGTPSTEILETLSLFPGVYAEWSVNEKVALEIAIGASLSGARALCAMKHVGMNVASDALMTITVAGISGGLVLAIADDVGVSSSQNEQDSRFWGRFAHVPVLEPADPQEALEMAKFAFELSQAHATPVILRVTTRVCHVKAPVTVGARVERDTAGFHRDPERWVLSPINARRQLPAQAERERVLAVVSEATPLNFITPGSDRRLGIVTSGAAYLHVRECFPDLPVLKLGLTYPVPLGLVGRFAAGIDELLVVEETEPFVEQAIRAGGIAARGKDVLPRTGELTPEVLRLAVAPLLGEPAPSLPPYPAGNTFPRPPTLCAACPHSGIYYVLARLRKKVLISGDIGCYALGAGAPWHALDTVVAMGSSMGIALGLDKARGDADRSKAIIAVIGDSTFLHMGMQGLLNIVYQRGNITVIILDNRTTAMTGGQDNAGSGRGVHGEDAPRVDFPQLVAALGVRPERIRVVDPYQLPVLARTVREETEFAEPSVVIAQRPCVLSDFYEATPPFRVVDEDCTGCSNCFNVGCPAIHLSRSEHKTLASGAVTELQFAVIDSIACTGCGLCAAACGPKAIVATAPADGGAAGAAAARC
ncbi:MAG: thiamine pyrophosphate-dependent enzyme [Gammaproteobacteria bacterium]|nr:thiamine pyrophosphate-dependent enzyme [Gammaproteobacteria bacterium]